MRIDRVALKVLVLAGAAWLAACLPEPAPSPPPPPPIRLPNAAFVDGTVTDASGAPVRGAAVALTAVRVAPPVPVPGTVVRIGGCEGFSYPPVRAKTDRAGEFSRTLDYGVSPPFEACLVVEVEPPADSALRSRMVSGQRLLFLPRMPDAPPADSARVDVVLP